LSLAGTLVFLIAFLMDREREAGIERLTHWRAPRSEASDGAELRAAPRGSALPLSSGFFEQT